MRTLIADDDNTFRSRVTEVPSNEGYEVSAHENGLLAWNSLQENGADDYLTKPFDNDVLVARVKVLERRILK